MKPSKPSEDSKKLPGGLAACLAVLSVACLFSYWHVVERLWKLWGSSPDMSHGYLVPVIAAGLLWIRRSRRPSAEEVGGWGWFALGIVILSLGGALRLTGILYRSTTIEAWSILPFCLGLTLCCGGRKGLVWAWPSVVFLAFMLPLPNSVGGLLSASLQRMATISSTYLLQLLGIPAIAQGNVIWLSQETVGVAEACNGLRMLTSFCAMAVAACFIIERPFWQNGIVLLSAPLIGVIANLLRVTATGAAYEWSDSEAFSTFIHDFAGWLMMPIGIAMLWGELKILQNVFLASDDDLQSLTPYHSTNGAAASG
ncbi:exosortase [Blastopirellula marina]|uniref:Exosortase n=1 Tax=Blastopirellula marina TaxID=124 RepID=A0A2S8GHE8_9BACT|nr:exosortase [Blastopirellula marina]